MNCLHCIFGMLDQGFPQAPGEFSREMVSGEELFILNEIKCCFEQNYHCLIISCQVSNLQISQPALKQNSVICLVIQLRLIITAAAHASQACCSQVIPQQLLSMLQVLFLSKEDGEADVWHAPALCALSCPLCLVWPQPLQAGLMC